MEHLLKKLSYFAPLGEADRAALRALETGRKRLYAGMEIAREGSPAPGLFTVTDGMVCRYKQLASGRRQILGFLIPGDIGDPHAMLVNMMDHSIMALSPARIATLDGPAAMTLAMENPRIAAAFWWNRLQEESILRERIASLGRRDAGERLAFLLCEFLWRFRAVDEAPADRIWLPLTQSDLADTLGLSQVHVNRMLQALRRDGLIVMRDGELQVLDADRLAERAGFSGTYLHLDGAAPAMARQLDRMSRGPARPDGAGPGAGPAAGHRNGEGRMRPTEHRVAAAERPPTERIRMRPR